MSWQTSSGVYQAGVWRPWKTQVLSPPYPLENRLHASIWWRFLGFSISISFCHTGQYCSLGEFSVLSNYTIQLQSMANLVTILEMARKQAPRTTERKETRQEKRDARREWAENREWVLKDPPQPKMVLKIFLDRFKLSSFRPWLPLLWSFWSLFSSGLVKIAKRLYFLEKIDLWTH